MMNKQCSLLIFLSLLDLLVLGSSPLVRKIILERAPGCVDANRAICEVNIFHVKAAGPNDTIHYVWDFTGKPSLLLAYTPSISFLSINWTDSNRIESVSFYPEPSHTFMIVMNKLVEFDDVDDTGYIKETLNNKTFNFDVIQWNLTKFEQNGKPSVELVGNQYNNTDPLLGSIVMQLAAFGEDGHDTILPRLLHSANSTQSRILLKNLSSKSGFNHSRWAIDVAIVTSDSYKNFLTVDFRKNLDDEHSPGVFSVVEVLAPLSGNETDRGFMHWRPVTYTNSKPSINNSSDVKLINPSTVADPLKKLNNSLAFTYHKHHLTDILVSHVIISFGESQDGFYKKSNFTSWAFLISYGTPQLERFSMLIILVMGIGLGLPAVVVLLGSIFLCVRRISRQRDEH